MAKQIKSSDLFEEEDIFKGLRDSAQKTIDVFDKLSLGMKQSAEEMKKSVNESVLSTTKGIENLMKTSTEATKLQEDSIKIDKAKAEALKQYAIAEQQLEKIEQEKEKTNQQKIKTAEQIKRAEEAELKRAAQKAKAANVETNAYKTLSAQARELKNESKNLAAELMNQRKAGLEGTSAFIDLQNEYERTTAEASKLDDELKKIDRAVGDNQRSVGDYEKATVSLKGQLRKLTQALAEMDSKDPRFQKMAMEAGELRDRIQDTQAVVSGLAGTGVENLAGGLGKVGKVGVDAFQGIESAGVLLGANTDQLMQTMVRLQALSGLGDALESLGGIGDKITEIKAAFTGAAIKLGLLTTAKEADVIATEVQAVATVEATVAQEGLNTAMSLNPIGLVVAAVLALVGAIAYFTMTSEKAAITQDDFNEVNKKTGEELGKVKGEVKEVGFAFEQARNGVMSKEKALKLYNEKFGATLGIAKNYNEAEKTFIKNADIYIRVSTLRAKADAFRALSAQTTADAFVKSQELEFKAMDMFELAKTKMLKGDKAAAKEARQIAINNAIEAQKEFNVRIDALDKQAEKFAQLANKEESKLVVIKEESEVKKTKIDKSALNERKKQQEQFYLSLGNIFKREVKLYESKYSEIKKLDLEKMAAEAEAADDALEARRKSIQNINEIELEMKGDYEGLAKEKLKNLKEDLEKELELLGNNQVAKAEKIAEYNQKKKQIEDDLAAKELEATVKRNEEIAKVVEASADFFIKKSNEKIDQIDKEMQAAQKQFDYYQDLAKTGNINAEQSLAEQQKIIDKAELKKEKELKKQQKIKLAQSIYTTYAAKVESGSKTPLVDTIKDTTLLMQFINSLPTFYEGTEDTGTNGSGIDNKGGFHAILHPNERVVPKNLNDKLKGISNEDLTKLATEYNNGNIVRKGEANQMSSALEFGLMIQKLDKLNETIQNKPEHSYDVARISSTLLEFVDKKKQGNTTIFNRYKVRK
jgi:DNA repair exonuclease SbcCD ATPase subunit